MKIAGYFANSTYDLEDDHLVHSVTIIFPNLKWEEYEALIKTQQFGGVEFEVPIIPTPGR